MNGQFVKGDIVEISNVKGDRKKQKNPPAGCNTHSIGSNLNDIVGCNCSNLEFCSDEDPYQEK